MSIKKKTQVMIVDDHPIMRHGLAQLIDAQPELEVCSWAGTALEALAAIPEKKPELALLDISLPDRNGLELLKDLRALHPEVMVLMVSMHDESLYAERALRAGAKGYIMKEEAADKLIEAIRTVLDGKIYVSVEMSTRIIEMFSGSSRASSVAPLSRLTDRELEVFEEIGKGKATREVAEMLGISARTVDAHRAHLKKKLGMKDGSELVRYAVRWVETGAWD
ncbi:MAG: response regulator transcription factor, partial [Verrucomicrobia bacterium]|nr:response regulator transcription factor [Verrucomicrobiota bacterium]